MAESVLALLIVIAAVFLLALGAFVGWALAGAGKRDEWPKPPTLRDDLAATSRTIQRLANEGAIDDQTHSKLFDVLREASARQTGPQFDHRRAPSAAVPPAGQQDAEAPPPVEPRRSLGAEMADASQPDEAVVAAEIVADVSPPPRVHPLDAPEPAVVPGPSPKQQRRRALADVLRAFMEDKNIRWGELVSGLLIVGCSIALVISLRREIESLSERFIYMPALLFMLATGAIHAAGNYTLRRWNLQATSRGVLIIATLLIPINFLAAIMVTGPESRQLPLLHPLYLSAVAVGIVAFGTMTYFAGQALLRDGWWRMWVGVMGTSMGQLIINRLADRQAGPLGYGLLVALPLGAYLVATMGQLQVAARRARIGRYLATDTLVMLGITSFALAAPIGLLLSRSDSLGTALAWLSTPLSLPSVVVLATGLTLSRRARSQRLATIRTIGTSLALLGGFMMLATVLLAWPEPEFLIAVGLFSFAALSLLAVVGRLPALHIPAIACGALAYLVGFHLLQHSFAGYEDHLSRRMLGVFLMGRSSAALTVLAALIGGAAGLFWRRGRRESGASYAAACVGLAGLSVFSALIAGFSGESSQDPDLAAPVLLFYAAAVLAASYFRPTAALTWIGSALLLLALTQGLTLNEVLREWLAAGALDPRRAVLVATLLHGFVAVVVALLLSRRQRRQYGETASPRWQQWIVPLTFSGLLTSALAFPFAIFVAEQRFGEHAWYVAAAALIWLAAAFVQRSSVYFAIFQAQATAAVVLTAASVCQQQTWWREQLHTPQHLQTQFGALAVWCLAWTAGRKIASRRWPTIVERMRWQGQAVDEMVLAATVLAMFIMCVVGCLPGAAIELGIAPAASFSELPAWRAVFASGSWIAVTLLLVAVTAALAERFSLTKLSELFLVGAVMAMLIAGRFYETLAVASALRWALAVYGTLMTIAICWGARIDAALRRLAWLRWQTPAEKVNEAARTWTLTLSATAILGLTTASLIQAAAGNPPAGPIAESFFGRIGSELSYGVPLALLVTVLIVHAVREKMSSLMLAGSGVFQYLVNLAYFLPILRDPNAHLDWPLVIGWMQWNCVGLAVFALVWLGLRHWLEPRHRDRFAGDAVGYLVVQQTAVVCAIVSMTGLASAAVVCTPGDLTDFADLGGELSYAACLLSFVALAWLVIGQSVTVGLSANGTLRIKRVPRQMLESDSHAAPEIVQRVLTRLRAEDAWISLAFAFACAVGGPLAISLEGAPGSWRGLHALMIVWAVIAALATVLVWIAPRWQRDKQLVDTSVQWASAFVALSVLLALRATPFDPQTPWWPFAMTLGAAILSVALGLRTRRQSYAYASTLTAAIAVTIVWWGAWPTADIQGVIELVQLNLIAIVTAALVWLFVELRYQRRSRRGFARRANAPAVHRLSAIAATVLLLTIVVPGFGLTGILGVGRRNVDIANLTGWIQMTLLGGLLIATLWDRQMKAALPLLYAWGAAALLMGLDEFDERFAYDRPTVFVAAGLVLAAYVACTGHLWRFGAHLAAMGHRIGVADPVGHLKRTSRWLPLVTLVIAAQLVLVQLCVVLAFPDRWMRVSAAFVPLLLAYGVGCQAQQSRRAMMQYAALALGNFSAVFAAWADIEPRWHDSYVLERAVRVLMVLAGLAFLYAIPLSRWGRHRDGAAWLPTIRRMSGHCSVAAISALAVVLVLELAYFHPGVGTPFGHPYQVVAVAVVLVGLIISLLAIALSPERDPWSLTEQGRMGYVYAAQIVSTLLFAHLYLSHPQLFGALKPYWPYIVMAIAFGGVGIGELFQRSGLRVLAEPLQRTGGFLPLLPALGWWLNRKLEIDAAGHYSLLMFFAGLLYVALSMLRHSKISGIAAAIAGNAAVWALLADYEPLSLLKHPQFWLIPPAVSTLAAAHINRRHFTESQLTAIRYLCLIVIYVSSTADIFIEGVGDTLWEPMVLATLSVMGVLVGIGLRIRAFLYLGAAFVFMSVVSMIGHAYANIQHVAIWWAFGIALGLMILTIFGLFEKKRTELMRVVERMRTWEP